MSRIRRVKKLAWWQLQTFEGCALHWKLAYLDRIKAPRVPQYLPFGGAIHEGFEHFLSDYYLHNTPDRSRLDTAIEDAGTRFEFKYIFEGAPNPDKWLPIGRRMIDVWARYLVDRDFLPAKLEVWGERNVRRAGEFLFQFRGKIDCLATVEGQPVVIDWKTAKYPYDEEKLRERGQLAAYRILAGEEWSSQALVVVTKDDPEVYWHQYTITPPELRAFCQRVAVAHEQMESLVEFEPVYDKDVCRWCQYTPEYCKGVTGLR